MRFWASLRALGYESFSVSGRGPVCSMTWLYCYTLSESILDTDASARSKHCTFTRSSAHHVEIVDMSIVLEVDALQLRKEVPAELVVSTFQKMVPIIPRSL
jgi:hypothetical protein